MIQFTGLSGRLGNPHGIVLLPDAVLAYTHGNYARMMFYDHRVFIPRLVATAGPNAGRVQTAGLDDRTGTAATKKYTPLLALGQKCYVASTGYDPDVHVGMPCPLTRMEATSVYRLSQDGNPVTVWASNLRGENPATPTQVLLGPRGGLYFKPLGMDRDLRRYAWDAGRLIGPAYSIFPRDPVAVLRQGPANVYYAFSDKRLHAFLPWGGPVTSVEVPLDHGQEVTDFAFTPDGGTMVAACRGTLKVHGEEDVRQWSSVRVYRFAWPAVTLAREYAWPATYVAVSADGLRAAALGPGAGGDSLEEKVMAVMGIPTDRFCDTLTVFDLE